MESIEFERVVNQVIESLPKEFRDKLDNVAIVVEDWPRQHQLGVLQRRGERGHRLLEPMARRGGMLLGLYEGIPHIRRGRYGIGGTLPDKITIFQRPIETIAQSQEHLEQIIKSTVLHEIAHHFGMDEKEVREAEGRS